MKFNSYSTFKDYFSQLYESICIVITTMLVGYSIFVYSQDRDISRIQYQDYHATQKDIYPSISLCFGDVLQAEKLQAYGVNASSYWEFLTTGENSDKKMFDINFHDVSIDLTYYLLGIEMYREGYNSDIEKGSYFLLDNTMNEKQQLTGNVAWSPKFYQDSNPYWGLVKKCLTIDVPFVPSNQTKWITIIMSRSVFLSGKRPYSAKPSKEVFSVDLHYPGQRYRFANTRDSWRGEEPKSDLTNSYGMRFQMSNMEVTHQRNTKNFACRGPSVEEDEDLKSYMIRKTNCIPPYWTKSKKSNTTRCTKNEELRSLYNMDIGDYIVPCRRLTSIAYKYSEYPSTYYDDVLQRKKLETE